MLTVHDCTFEVNWSGWGPRTMYAERVALGFMYGLLRESPERAHRLAHSQRAQKAEGIALQVAVLQLLVKNGKSVPSAGTITVKGFPCPKV